MVRIKKKICGVVWRAKRKGLVSCLYTSCSLAARSVAMGLSPARVLTNQMLDLHTN